MVQGLLIKNENLSNIYKNVLNFMLLRANRRKQSAVVDIKSKMPLEKPSQNFPLSFEMVCYIIFKSRNKNVASLR